MVWLSWKFGDVVYILIFCLFVVLFCGVFWLVGLGFLFRFGLGFFSIVQQANLNSLLSFAKLQQLV